jgi:LmbE family N-acetylglucosaminyl deacetylase
VRDREMQEAAALFRGTATQWGFPDVMDGVANAWDAAAGGRDALLGRLRSIVDVEDPTLIITFDPRHGTTCHPAHRHLGSLVHAAAGDERLFFVETAAAPDGEGYRFSDALLDRSWSFDVVRSWSYLIADAIAHASQFSATDVAALAATPDEQRVVWLAPAAAAERASPSVCP